VLIGGIAAVAVGGAILLKDLSQGLVGNTETKVSNAVPVLALAGAVAAVVGGGLMGDGSARRAEAAASWNAAHPEAPVVP
jgi:hypothetical protein